MKNLYLATVTLSCSETNSFGKQKETAPVSHVPVWAHDEKDAREQIELYYNDDFYGSPGNWVRVKNIELNLAIGNPIG